MTTIDRFPSRTSRAAPPAWNSRVFPPDRRGQLRLPNRSSDRDRGPRPPVYSDVPLQYPGCGVSMSRTSHLAWSEVRALEASGERDRSRTVTIASTVGLAVLAGVITVWLGLIAQWGEAVNGAERPAEISSSALTVVRVQAGETLQTLAARVAPGVPPRQEAARIREINALDSASLTAGQTLIAPVG